MNKIKLLDLTLTELHKKTKSGNLITPEELNQTTNIDKHTLTLALDYLCSLNYCEKTNYAYKILFEGEYYIDKNVFIIKNRPFLIEYLYKKLKITALLLNTLFVLTLGILNYQNNLIKNKSAPVIDKSKSSGIPGIENGRSNSSSHDTVTHQKIK